jgi:uncharacterized protein YajQ (UPF0234 family)
MAKSCSFDIVSEVNMAEVLNAVNQAVTEIRQRYDFKGSKSEIKLEEKENQLETVRELHKTYLDEADKVLKKLQESARSNKNVFAELMEATKYCSIGQITRSLFDVGGQYRRNM